MRAGACRSSDASAAAAGVFGATFGGFSGAAAGLLVGVKQVSPEFSLGSLGGTRFQARHLPVAAVGLCLALAAARLLPPWRFRIVLYGTFSGWVYLRYFQQRPVAGGGDGYISKDARAV